MGIEQRLLRLRPLLVGVTVGTFTFGGPVETKMVTVSALVDLRAGAWILAGA